MRHHLKYNTSVLDLVLEMFDGYPGGFISHDQLYRKGRHLPDDQDEVLSFLLSEGLLEQRAGGFKITYKGRMVIHSGGFKKTVRKDRLVFWCAVVAAVSGVLSIALQILLQLIR